MKQFTAFVILLVPLSGTATAQEWTRFRGPNGNGIGHSSSVPTKWDLDDYNWKTELPGIGHGSPVVWGRRLFVQSADEDGAERFVLAVDTESGELLWRRPFPFQNHRKHRKNSFASSTPAVDTDRVYVAWGVPGTLTLAALDHDGQFDWETDLGSFKGGHGFAGSPIVIGNLVVLANDQDGRSSLIAVNCQTGDVVWEVPRQSERTTYSTPCVYERPGREPELVFTNWRHGITGVDPASGRMTWELSVFDQSHKERAIGSPVVAGDLIIGTCGFVTAQKHVVAVRPGGSGRPDDVEEVYRIERAVPHIPTVLVHKQRLYLWSDKGIVTCCDAQTGESIWQRRVGGNYFGSPVCVTDRLFCMNDDGEVVVLAAADEYRELARNPLGEPSHSTPAVARETMFLRTYSHLLSIGGK